jgi:hypothetical protein
MEAAMTEFDVTLLLPDDVAAEAAAQGLLTPTGLAQLIQAELGRRKFRRLQELRDQLAAVEQAPLTEAELNAEIAAVRAERRGHDARGD